VPARFEFGQLGRGVLRAAFVGVFFAIAAVRFRTPCVTAVACLAASVVEASQKMRAGAEAPARSA
jgi:hypothetical protein